MFIVLNIRVVWLYVPLISMVYVQVNAIEYEYRIKNDRCSNHWEYDGYRQMPCSTFTTTKEQISIISFSLSSKQILEDGYQYHGYTLGLRVINSNNITELSANDFPMRLFQQSRYLLLDLSHNNIQKIHPGAFIAFTDLLEVNLAMNFLTTLNNAYLSPLLKLQKINISRNSINTISDTAFANQLDLSVLDLSFNNISHIPNNTFTKQEYLDVLLLQGNRIKQFDLNFPEPGGGWRLDLSYNLLQTVSMPEHFRDINLSHNNNITVFSAVVSDKLESLNVSHNYIKTINPNSFVNAVGLLKLDLSHNLLTSIPTSSFQKVKKLHYLDLSHNLIHENSYSSDNNWNSFFLNFKELTQIALDGNYWKCSDLKDIIYLISLNNPEIIRDSTHNTTNIHGIGCNSTTNTSTTEITYNPSERIQSLINQQIGEEFKSLYLNYTALLALQTVQTNESKIIMESLSSVKAEISKLKVALNSLNTTVNATEMEQKLIKHSQEVNKSLNESVGSVKTEISKLKVALNSLNTTLPNAPNLVKTGTSNELIQIIIKILLDSIKTEISKLKETLNPHPSTAEIKTMQDTQSSGNAGTIITNICLVIVICCMIFFTYVYYKNKRNVKSLESEHLSLS